MNTPNPYRQGGAFPDRQLAATTSQSNSTGHASDELKPAWPVNEDSLQRAVSLEQGQLLASGIDDFSHTYFHHLSPYSRGLLTDTKNGGLKLDLTLPFENDDVFFRWFGRNRESETPVSGLTTEGGYTRTGAPEKFFISPVFWQANNKQVGPNWGTMKHYHSLYEKTANSGSGAFPIVFPHPTAGIQLRRTGWNPYTQYSDPSMGSAQHSTDFQHTNNYVAPIPCRMQMGYRLSAIRDVDASDGSPQYVFELDFKPLVGIWDSYNVTFRPNRYRFAPEIPPTTGKLQPTWGAAGYFKMIVPSQVATPPEGAAFQPLRVSKDARVRVISFSLSEGTLTRKTDGRTPRHRLHRPRSLWQERHQRPHVLSGIRAGSTGTLKWHLRYPAISEHSTRRVPANGMDPMR